MLQCKLQCDFSTRSHIHVGPMDCDCRIVQVHVRLRIRRKKRATGGKSGRLKGECRARRCHSASAGLEPTPTDLS